jgi:hypothetical protein
METKSLQLIPNEEFVRIFTNQKMKNKHIKKYFKFKCTNPKCKNYNKIVNALKPRYCLFCDRLLREVKLRCKKCNYTWRYEGIAEFPAKISCPKCSRKSKYIIK